MPIPSGSVTSASRRKKKACRRCRYRKQRCDFEQPRHNCVAVGVECLPIVQEPIQNYPAGYVPALENHAAMLERTLSERYPGTAIDHPEAVRNQHFQGQSVPIADGIDSSYLNFQTGASHESERFWQWPAPQNPIGIGALAEEPRPREQSHSSPLKSTSQISLAHEGLSRSLPIQGLVSRPDGMDEIPHATSAAFFRTSFQAIHPQYPFLSVKDCGGGDS